MHESDHPSIEPEGTFDGLRPFPILFGAAVDHLATQVGLTVLVLWASPTLGDGSPEAREAAREVLSSDPVVAASLAVGAACTVLGAFVGARWAGQLHVRHGGWIAVISTALSALFLLVITPSPEAAANQAQYPFWADAVGWLLIIPSGMLGGALAAVGAPPQEGSPPRFDG